ncbi:MAG: choice-of-anchor D domain-containing protein [Gemmatimonadales bacterium]|nr:MAG: choice-of-anchor D domain-containing protein [Gemmatimonadales bacterium]
MLPFLRRGALAASAAVLLLLSGCSDESPTEPYAERDDPLRAAPAVLVSSAWSGGAILVSPTGLDFSDVQVGTTSPTQAVSVTNVGAEPVVMSGAGGGAGVFGGSQDCQGLTLAPGASCSMFYAFTPGEAGVAIVTTSGTWNGEPFEIELRGHGVAPRFRITGTSLDFGYVPVGSAVQLPVSVTNISLEAVVVSMAGGAAGEFGGSQNCQGNTLAPGASCQVTYTFAPSEAGLVEGSTGGSVNGQPFALTMRGVGVAPSFRITATSFDFGEVEVGSSLQQNVVVTNTSTVAVTVAMAGGAAGAFGGSQNCQGNTLAPGASCQIIYTFSPGAIGEVTSTTSGTVNGQPFAFSFRGVGIASATSRTLQFRVARRALDFGNVQVGHSSQQSIDVVNAGSSAVVVSMAGGAAGDFGGSQNCQGNTLAPGASCQITYTFAPTAAGEVTGSTSGTINGEPFSLAFRGFGMPARFRVSPTSLDFGALQVGASLPQVVTVTNVGSDPAIISLAGGAAGEFGGSQNCQANTLAPGVSCEITYTFAPSASGVVTGSTGGSVNGQSFSFSMRGEGLAPRFRITPYRWDHGPVDVGATSQRAVSVTNVGRESVVISMAGGAAGPFGGSQNCQGSTMPVGGSCTITYTFAPSEPGLVTGSTGGSVNGQPFAFAMRGTGRGLVAPGFSFLGFSGPVVVRKQFKAPSAIPVHAAFGHGDGTPLTEQDAVSLAAACRVRVVFSGEPAAQHCASYDIAGGTFQVVLKLDKSLVPGTYLVTAELVDGAVVAAVGTRSIVVN